MNELSPKKYLDYLILSPIFWAFTGLFAYSGGKKFIVILIILSVISSLYSYGFKLFLINFKGSKWLWLLVSYSLFAIWANYYYKYDSAQLRALLSISVYLVFFPPHLISKINLKYLTIA